MTSRMLNRSSARLAALRGRPGLTVRAQLDSLPEARARAGGQGFRRALWSAQSALRSPAPATTTQAWSLRNRASNGFTLKVLPKFHGSRGKFEAPLKAVLAWCAGPDAPDHLPVSLALDQVQDAEQAVGA